MIASRCVICDDECYAGELDRDGVCTDCQEYDDGVPEADETAREREGGDGG